MGNCKKRTSRGLLYGLILLLLASPTWAATLKISGADNVDDAKVAGGAGQNRNYGGATTITVTSTPSFVRVKNLSSLLPTNAKILSCVLSLYCTVNTADDTIYFYRVFKPWVEGDEDNVDNDDGDITWLDWASDEFEWGTGPCACAGDDGVDNSQDGTCDQPGRDRKATEEGFTFVDAVDTWYEFNVSAALAQAWYDGTAVENGLLLLGGRMPLGAGDNTFASTENETVENRPFWTITYRISRKARILKITQ
jgi:hypothetical protein